jgi:tetratricopeptide (TPR) repeat protein
MESQLKRGAFLFLLLAATVLVYARTTAFSFLSFDDTPSIINNEAMRHWSSLPWFFSVDVWQGTNPAALMYYRPVFQGWLLLNFKLFGLNGGLWHAAAILLYGLSVLLAWKLARKLSGSEFVAAAGALFYAVHPLHVESVSWLSGAVDPLMSVFFFGGFLAYFRWRETRKREWLLACAALAALALFTKEAGMALPVLIGTYEWMFPSGGSSRKARISLGAALGITVLFYLGARAIALTSLVTRQDHRSWLDVLRMAPKLICLYLAKGLWPAHVAAWYDVRLGARFDFAGFYAPLLLVLTLAAGTVWFLRRRGKTGFFLLWWWIALAPSIAGVLTLPEFDLAHDRYTYLSLFGLSMVLATSLRRLPGIKSDVFRSSRMGFPLTAFPAAQSAVALLLAGTLAALSAREVNTWKDDIAMYSHAVEVSPRAIRPHALLGNEYLKRARFDQALRLYSETRDLDPGNWWTNYAYAAALYRARHYDEALAAIQRTARVEPRVEATYPLWADILRLQGKKQDAIEVLQAGIRQVPDSSALEEQLREMKSQ